jgi:hypothetical protein
MSFRPFSNEQYGTVQMFFLSSAVWFMIATVIGFIDATHLAAPELIGNISWLVFGRTRPMHTGLFSSLWVGAARGPTMVRPRRADLSANGGKLSLWSGISPSRLDRDLASAFPRQEYAEWICRWIWGACRSCAHVRDL